MATALEQKAINTIRFLAADMVQQARSGHPGLPMGCAAMAYTIWKRHLRHDPSNPKWFGRDRFLLSGGHGSALLYALLHLTGYELSLDELKRFRQLGSKTPGHPEFGLTPGVEMTTGPLGQGFATGVGMAIAQSHLAARFPPDLVDTWIYAIVTDGDLMEGVVAEAASLAGTLQLGRLIYLYDDNHISIDGPTELAFGEDRLARFAAYGWHTQTVPDGNDVEAIDRAIQSAKADPRPSIIACRTHIGFGAPHRQDTAKAHGEPLGDEELAAAKANLGWPPAERFLVPEDVAGLMRTAVVSGKSWHEEWKSRLADFQKRHPDGATELIRRVEGKLPDGWEKHLPIFQPDEQGIATRVASGKVLSALAPVLPELLGGSADLTPSNNTRFDLATDYSPSSRNGRYIHYGVREHGMAAIMNGMARYGGVIPYGGTFLVFSDYMRGAIRLAALSHLPSIFVLTHDSIGLGEDGPTHQPVEHLAALRAIPNLLVLRPADANEVAESWKIAIARREGPTVLALSRQNLPIFERTRRYAAALVKRGAYTLAEFGKPKPEVVLLASGSEVALAVQTAKGLASKGRSVRVVSMPAWSLFEEQSKSYQDSVLPPDCLVRVAIEAGVSMGWHKYVGSKGAVISLERFGASAPAKDLFQHFGFVPAKVERAALKLLRDRPPGRSGSSRGRTGGRR